jgi:cation transport ATPase
MYFTNHRDLVLSQSDANVIWWAAWFSLAASMHAVHIQQSELAIVPACVLFTSLNYWRNPLRNSWRRSIDIGTVLIGCAYNSALAYSMTDSHHRRTYFNCVAASSLFYTMGHLLMTINMPRTAAYAHAGIHVVANVGNIALQRAAIENQRFQHSFKSGSYAHP